MSFPANFNKSRPIGQQDKLAEDLYEKSGKEKSRATFQPAARN